MYLIGNSDAEYDVKRAECAPYIELV